MTAQWWTRDLSWLYLAVLESTAGVIFSPPMTLAWFTKGLHGFLQLLYGSKCFETETMYQSNYKAFAKGNVHLKLCCQPNSISLPWCSLPTFRGETGIYTNKGCLCILPPSVHFSTISAVWHTEWNIQCLLCVDGNCWTFIISVTAQPDFLMIKAELIISRLRHCEDMHISEYIF